MINDNYSIEVTGNRSLQAAEDTVRKMLTIAQMVIGNPNVPGQRAIIKPLLEKSGYDSADIEKALGPEQNQGVSQVSQQGQPGQSPQQGMPGLGGASTIGNDMQAMAVNQPQIGAQMA